jgi:hypothetical protein
MSSYTFRRHSQAHMPLMSNWVLHSSCTKTDRQLNMWHLCTRTCPANDLTDALSAAEATARVCAAQGISRHQPRMCNTCHTCCQQLPAWVRCHALDVLLVALVGLVGGHHVLVSILPHKHLQGGSTHTHPAPSPSHHTADQLRQCATVVRCPPASCTKSLRNFPHKHLYECIFSHSYSHIYSTHTAAGTGLLQHSWGEPERDSNSNCLSCAAPCMVVRTDGPLTFAFQPAAYSVSLPRFSSRSNSTSLTSSASWSCAKLQHGSTRQHHAETRGCLRNAAACPMP